MVGREEGGRGGRIGSNGLVGYMVSVQDDETIWELEVAVVQH